MTTPRFLPPADAASFEGVVLDCRFSLADPYDGLRAYEQGHLPGARHLDLATQLSGPVGEHGGRHPLPTPQAFAETLAAYGIDAETPVLLYDDSRYAFAARAWWMLRALGYREPAFLQGGYQAWRLAGGDEEVGMPAADAVPAQLEKVPSTWPQSCDRDGLRQLQSGGVRLLDAREAPRYRGEQEPIDPIAGHIPGADNMPWAENFNSEGEFLANAALRELWAPHLEAETLAMYCGSGVTACVNILALAMLGRDDVVLYGGSWSDWCSYLPKE